VRSRSATSLGVPDRWPGHGHAETPGDEHLGPVDQEGAVERDRHGVGDRRRPGGGTGTHAERHELVAAEPGDGHVVADGDRRQPA
jgi:hypothetical protein